jgi:hypothetical protein
MSRDSRLRRRALRSSAMPRHRDARCSSLRANPHSMGRLPPASSRHCRPAATTSLCMHVMQRLSLPLGAKRLKPGMSRQAASRARQATLSSPQQASAAACADALPCVCVRWRRLPLRPTPRAAVKHKRQERGVACPSRIAGTATARWHSCLAARMQSPTPVSALACTAPLYCAKRWQAPRRRQAIQSVAP